MAAAGAAHPGAGKGSSRHPGLEGGLGGGAPCRALLSFPAGRAEAAAGTAGGGARPPAPGSGEASGGFQEGRRETPDSQGRLQGFSLRQGATDSEKRVQHLTLENEALKQSLSLMRDLLLHWGPAPSTRAPQVSSLATPVPTVWGS